VIDWHWQANNSVVSMEFVMPQRISRRLKLRGLHTDVVLFQTVLVSLLLLLLCVSSVPALPQSRVSRETFGTYSTSQQTLTRDFSKFLCQSDTSSSKSSLENENERVRPNTDYSSASVNQKDAHETVDWTSDRKR
jgi:hypothetical protein